MVDSLEDREFRKRMSRVESLLQELERLPDPKARARTQDILQAVMDLHGAALERILDKLADAGAPGLAVIDALGDDDLAGSVLLLHGLHPLDLETRVRHALDKVRPLLRSHGGNVELLSLDEGVARLRMVGSCDGCPSSALTLKQSIEEAIYEKAPDVTAIEVEGMEKHGLAAIADNSSARIALPLLSR